MEARFSAVFAARVAEFEVRELPDATPRRVRLAEVPGKADVVVGMRRVGKSWLLLDRIQELIAGGVPRSRILYCEFEDERLAGLRGQDLGALEEAFFARYPESRDEECWYFFDEIQEVEGWEKFVRRLLSDPRRRIVLTGSSARLLGREIATNLRGRALATELLPFSFAEAADHRSIAVPARWPTAGKQRSKLQHAFEQFFAVGGFPEVQALPDDLWRRTLQSYVEIAVLRDIAERNGITNLPALRFLVRRLLRSVGSPVSAHGLFQDLKSQKLAAGKDTVYEYLQHIEDSYLLLTLPLCTDSERRRQMNPRKVYAVDHGLVRANTPSHILDTGHHLENIVYLELRRRSELAGYYLTRSKREVDFVTTSASGQRQLVQVCATLDAEGTRERELRALDEAAEETGITDLTIVTLHEEGLERAGEREVRVVPAWRYLLEVES